MIPKLAKNSVLVCAGVSALTAFALMGVIPGVGFTGFVGVWLTLIYVFAMVVGGVIFFEAMPLFDKRQSDRVLFWLSAIFPLLPPISETVDHTVIFFSTSQLAFLVLFLPALWLCYAAYRLSGLEDDPS